MIDAVNTPSVQSAASRAPQAAVAASVAPAPDLVKDADDFTSSRLITDNLQNATILQVRDSKTGQVIQQYPSDMQIQAFQRAKQAAEEKPPQLQTQTSSSAPSGGGADGAQSVMA